MFKVMALTSLVLFAFMAGVIFGAKNNNTPTKLYTSNHSSAPLAAPDVSKKIAPIKKTIKLESVKKPKEPKSNKRSGYTLVLSSFRTAESANAHAKSISQKGFDAFAYATSINGITWHRVGLGSFPKRSGAENLKKQLVGKSFAKGSLISKLPAKIR